MVAKNKTGKATAKPKAKKFKLYLDNPFVVQRPAFEPGFVKDTERELSTVFRTLSLDENLSAIDKRNEKIREYLVVGFNEVMRAVEKDDVIAVFVKTGDDSPILDPVYQLCQVRNVTVLTLTNPCAFVSDYFPVKNVLIFALRKSIKTDHSTLFAHFYEQFITKTQKNIKDDVGNDCENSGEVESDCEDQKTCSKCIKFAQTYKKNQQVIQTDASFILRKDPSNKAVFSVPSYQGQIHGSLISFNDFLQVFDDSKLSDFISLSNKGTERNTKTYSSDKTSLNQLDTNNSNAKKRKNDNLRYFSAKIKCVEKN